MTTPLDLAAIRERHDALGDESCSCALQCHADRGALLAVAEAAAALLDALPRCDGERDANDPDALYTLPMSECTEIATHTDGFHGHVRFCDRHAYGTLYELPYAAELRALSAALGRGTS